MPTFSFHLNGEQKVPNWHVHLFFSFKQRASHVQTQGVELAHTHDLGSKATATERNSNLGEGKSKRGSKSKATAKTKSTSKSNSLLLLLQVLLVAVLLEMWW